MTSEKLSLTLVLQFLQLLRSTSLQYLTFMTIPMFIWKCTVATSPQTRTQHER